MLCGWLWITGKSIITSLDELSFRTTNNISKLELSIVDLKKKVEDLAIHAKLAAKERASAPEASKVAQP